MAAVRNLQAGANPTVWLQAGGGPHGGQGLGPRARNARLDVAKEAIAALSQHAAIDEQVVYPAVPAQLPDETDTVFEALDEHHAATWLLSKLDGMTPTMSASRTSSSCWPRAFDTIFGGAGNEMFVKLRKSCTKRELDDLGDSLATAKEAAPTQPIPVRPTRRPATSSPPPSHCRSTWRAPPERPQRATSATP